VGLPPPMPPPSPTPPPLNEAFTEEFTAAAASPRSFTCKSRKDDYPMSKQGVPMQYVHVPKAAGSSIQMLLAYYVAIPQDLFFIVGEVEDYPHVPPGTMFAGHNPIVNSPDSKFKAKRDFFWSNPFFMSTMRDPLPRIVSLYDYHALFNMSMCEGELDEDGYYPRVGYLDIWWPGPSVAICAMDEQFHKDEMDALASGVCETCLMDHFFKARHPYVMQLVRENQYNWFIPRDDFNKQFPTSAESALACAMANALRTDAIINADRFDDTIMPVLKYHAPHLPIEMIEEQMGDITQSNVHTDARPPQVLSPESISEIERMPSFIIDQRFYVFAEKITQAREANMYACLNGDKECSDTCDGVLTEDEYLMIKNADCGEHNDLPITGSYDYVVPTADVLPSPYPYPEPGAVPGSPGVPPVKAN
jgi:hypothetical protein